MMRRVFGEDVIRALATEESFSRGKVYFLNSAVSDLVRRGNVLIARVEGNKFPPYDVMITLHDSGVTETARRDRHGRRGRYTLLLPLRLGRRLQACRRRASEVSG